MKNNNKSVVPLLCISPYWLGFCLMYIYSISFHFFMDKRNVYISASRAGSIETTDTASSASFFDLYLEFDDSGQLSTTIYDKRDDFNFKIINFPNMCSNIPASPACGVRNWFVMQGPVAIILISWSVIFIWETGYWTRAIKRFALFDLLKSLYSDTKILSKYIPSLQKRL